MFNMIKSVDKVIKPEFEMCSFSYDLFVDAFDFK